MLGLTCTLAWGYCGRQMSPVPERAACRWCRRAVARADLTTPNGDQRRGRWDQHFPLWPAFDRRLCLASDEYRLNSSAFYLMQATEVPARCCTFSSSFLSLWHFSIYKLQISLKPVTFLHKLCGLPSRQCLDFFISLNLFDKLFGSLLHGAIQ